MLKDEQLKALQPPSRRIVIDNGSGTKLVLTEICDRCDTETKTTICSNCKGTFCDPCIPKHKCEDYIDDDTE
jgi:hypothetical protein